MKKTLYVVAVILFLMNLMLVSVLTLSFNSGYYEKVYDRLDTAYTIGMSEEDLTLATETLLSYTRGKRDSLDLQVSVDGKRVEMFNEREKAHMVDVRALHSNAITFINVSSIFIAIMLVISLGSGDYLNMMLSYRTTKYAMMVLGTLVVSVGLLALIDFNRFWVGFHEVLFTNDLWLLNSNVDRLIMMVPQEFFMGLVYRIIAAIGVIMVFAGGVVLWFKKVGKNV